jgi:glycosyltransferase involved in cell wall biosynthesis
VYFSRRVHLMLYGREVSRLLREEPWDLVHCWEEPYIAAAAQVARATPSRVPLVFATFQNIDKRYPPPFNWFERYASRRADAMVAYGHTVASVLQGRGFPAAKTRVIPPGVDTTRFAPDAHKRDATLAALGWTGDVPVVGYLGRFVPEKGLITLMSVLDRLRAPWRALFIGSGPLESQIGKWAETHPGRVSIETHVEHADVPKWLNALDVLCAPSRTTDAWREQFGRMLIEAFACGVPVVASDSGEIPHVVADAGLIVPESDEARWVQTLEDLLADPVRRAALAQRGRARAVGVYDWSVIARDHTAFFNEVIDARAARMA